MHMCRCTSFGWSILLPFQGKMLQFLHEHLQVLLQFLAHQYPLVLHGSPPPTANETADQRTSLTHCLSNTGIVPPDLSSVIMILSPHPFTSCLKPSQWVRPANSRAKTLSPSKTHVPCLLTAGPVSGSKNPKWSCFISLDFANWQVHCMPPSTKKQPWQWWCNHTSLLQRPLWEESSI